MWLLIRTDGTMRIYYDATDTTGSNKSSGTWTKPNDSTINWSAPEWGELATAKICNNSSKMVGTWGLTPSYTSEGQLEMDRQ